MNQLKIFRADISQIADAFSKYVLAHKFSILLLSLFTFLIHGSKLYSINLGIDTEKVLDDPEDIYNSWHSIGRYGLTTIKQLLEQVDFNPFFAAILTILLLILAMTAFGFLFAYAGSCARRESFTLFAFGATVIAHPIMTEQLYFSLQGVEVSLSFLLCAVSLLFAHEWCLKGGVLHFVCAVFFLPLIFSVYQSFVPLYIFGVIALCCIYLPFTSLKNTFSIYFKYIGLHIVIFLSGLLINQMITNRFFGQSSYLTNQIYWNKNNVTEGFRKILSHIASVCLGYGTFYSPTFFLIAGLLFLLWIFIFLRYPNKRGVSFTEPDVFTKSDKPNSNILPERNIFTVKRIFDLLLLMTLYLTPFYLTIFLGEHPVARAQLVLPFTTGFMLYLISILLRHDAEADRQNTFSHDNNISHDNFSYNNFPRDNLSDSVLGLSALSRKICKFAFLTVSVLCIWNEADITSRMYYTDALRFEQDLNLAESIARDISKATKEADYAGTLVFVGQKPVTYNSTYVKGDVMGQSFFAWDTAVEPINCWSSHRIVGFMNCMGSHFQAPTQEVATSATALAASMSCYPQEGSILVKNEFVIVKLSE